MLQQAGGTAMNTFCELTALIPILKNDTFGHWIVDTENDGSPQHPKQMPFENPKIR